MDRSFDAIVVFARVPVAGRVKTRLAAELGGAAALAAYREITERVLAAVAQPDSRRLTVRYTPDDGRVAMRAWLGSSLTLQPQGPGDLGRRMTAAIGAELRDGASRVVVIGTDCPSVDQAVIAEAFERLAAADVVLGPALDGGYYLIGMSHLHSALFEGVPWSSPHTLRVTLKRARDLDLSVALLDRRRDIDTADDWRAWAAERDQRA